MAVVIVREDLIGRARPDTPAMLNYATVIGADSMYNTPPCFCIYMMGLVLEWLEKEVGGLAAMQRRNEAKAALLYDYLDTSRFFQKPGGKTVPQHDERHLYLPPRPSWTRSSVPGPPKTAL